MGWGVGGRRERKEIRVGQNIFKTTDVLVGAKIVLQGVNSQQISLPLF